MTPAQLKVLDFVRDTIVETGVAPTYAEIAQAVYANPARKAIAHAMVGKLIRDGHLVRRGRRGVSSGHRDLDLPSGNIRSVPTFQLRAELARREKHDG